MRILNSYRAWSDLKILTTDYFYSPKSSWIYSWQIWIFHNFRKIKIFSLKIQLPNVTLMALVRVAFCHFMPSILTASTFLSWHDHSNVFRFTPHANRWAIQSQFCQCESFTTLICMRFWLLHFSRAPITTRLSQGVNDISKSNIKSLPQQETHNHTAFHANLLIRFITARFTMSYKMLQ